ncbi:ataxin-2 homolog isoform X20 [Drosophila suzukii]|uniref:Ataxin-2 homolog isoform X20 n=1 Tax=Drosophila suzukii TaxID=28584 RepID=A0ABM4TPN6_DROSZ
MAALQRKLVHKQFNSPMGLYSQENVKATLNRELKAFGGEGIEVDDQITKPLNLANSAVLRAVEEEEQQAKSGYKRVAWPPASEERIIREFTPQPQTQSPAPGAGGYYPQAQAQAHAPAAAAPPQQQQYGAPSYGGYPQQQQPQQPAAQWQQQQQQQVPQQQYQPQSQAQAPYQPPQWNQQQQQQQPPQQQQPSYQASPYPQQQQQQQQQPSYYPQQNGGSTYAQPPYNSYSQPQVPYSQDQTDLQQQQLPGAFAGQESYRGASPGIITLRKEAPVSQQPAPVYSSQPAAVSYQGGSKLRGDLKWPPPEYKEAAARENEERRQLALGPVCRPRRINRDYTPFFAKHQLNNGYPSYKVPPGTQHIFG